MCLFLFSDQSSMVSRMASFALIASMSISFTSSVYSASLKNVSNLDAFLFMPTWDFTLFSPEPKTLASSSFFLVYYSGEAIMLWMSLGACTDETLSLPMGWLYSFLWLDRALGLASWFRFWDADIGGFFVFFFCFKMCSFLSALSSICLANCFTFD